MLQQERHMKILELLSEKKSLEISDITNILGISESTARRDITALDKEKKLKKVFGGAILLEDSIFLMQEPSVAQKRDLNVEAKDRIGKYAASLIEDDDFIYIDAGTTTGFLVKYMTNKKVSIVTNAVAHAQHLAANGFRVILIGGQLKDSTEAIVGNLATVMLQRFHFTKGFFGSNAVSNKAGLTTHDTNEALVKETAISLCKKAYALVDSSKFDRIAPVTFAKAGDVILICEDIPDGYENYKHIKPGNKDS